MDCYSTATSRLRRVDGEEWEGGEVQGPQQQPRARLPAAGKVAPHMQTWAHKVNSIGVMFKNGHVAEGVGCSTWPCSCSAPTDPHNTTACRGLHTAAPASARVADPQQMQHDPSCQRTLAGSGPMHQQDPLQRQRYQQHPQHQEQLQHEQWQQQGHQRQQQHHHQQQYQQPEQHPQQQRSDDLAQASVQTELPHCTPGPIATPAIAGHKRRRSSGDDAGAGTSGQCLEAAWTEAGTAAEHGAAYTTTDQPQQEQQQEQQEQHLELRRQRLAALRRVCCVRTMMLLLTECPQMPEPLFLRLPQLSQQLEGQLFASATSLEEYADWSTLRARLRLAGAALRQGQGAWACPPAPVA